MLKPVNLRQQQLQCRVQLMHCFHSAPLMISLLGNSRVHCQDLQDIDSVIILEKHQGTARTFVQNSFMFGTTEGQGKLSVLDILKMHPLLVGPE